MNASMAYDFPIQIIFKILASVLFLIYWGVNFVILYHLTRFGIGVQPKRFAAIFLFGSLALSVVAIILFMNVDINLLIPK